MRNFLPAILAIQRRSYRSAVLEDSPVVYFRLAETSGTTAYDEMGTANGTYVGSPTLGQTGPMTGLTSTKFNRATTDKVTFGGVSTFAFIPATGIFTIEAWMRLGASNLDEYNIVLGTSFGSGENGFAFLWENRTAVSSPRTLRFISCGGALGSPIITSLGPNNLITDTEWHHVAVTGNGTTIKFYVDGVESSGSGTMGTKATGNLTRPATIAYVDTGLTCEGTLAEVAVYNTTLSAARILAHHTAGINS